MLAVLGGLGFGLPADASASVTPPGNTTEPVPSGSPAPVASLTPVPFYTAESTSSPSWTLVQILSSVGGATVLLIVIVFALIALCEVRRARAQ